jgi:hypothetical protein
VDAGGRDITVDLRHVSTVDRAGVAVLVMHARLLTELGGSLEVVDASPPLTALVYELRLASVLGCRWTDHDPGEGGTEGHAPREVRGERRDARGPSTRPRLPEALLQIN